MQIAAPPPRGSAGPTLATLHEIEAILRDAADRGEGPLRLAEIERRMAAKRVRHATIRAVVDELRRYHLVTEGSGGVMWVFTSADEVWDAPRESLL